ncbi:rhodanese-like domain-containing protein [Enterococcus bulliens]
MYRSISMPEFDQELKKDIQVIDVRERDEFANGHVPKAINKPLSELSTQITDMDDEAEYYIICQSGGRSAQACAYLAEQGFDVINVMGGTSAYTGHLEQ